jgi:uncharacterized membrane protein YtjA (UPF0391 family)
MSLAFLIVGVLLMIGGIRTTHSLGEDIARLLNGSPSGRAVWLLLAGLIVGAFGLMDLLKRVQRGWWDALFSPLSFLAIGLIAGLQGFSSNTTLTTSIAGVFFVVALVLFLVSLLQSNRR